MTQLSSLHLVTRTLSARGPQTVFSDVQSAIQFCQIFEIVNNLRIPYSTNYSMCVIFKMYVNSKK